MNGTGGTLKVSQYSDLLILVRVDKVPSIDRFYGSANLRFEIGRAVDNGHHQQ